MRFPVRAENKTPNWCPKCKSPILLVFHYSERQEDFPKIKEPDISEGFSILLDNIRSVYNVGSIFRSADGFNINHIYLCGITATPDDPKIAKTSLGAEKEGFWSYSPNSLIKSEELLQEGKFLVGLEYCTESRPIVEFEMQNEKGKMVLIIGNEVAGIDPQVRKLCKELVFIPMQGEKSSYNVSVAFGIAAFYLNYICH
jgi:23S rRNA (guanosine2251-2'-O)-methyltransferase